MRPTLKDVARLAGVSHITASRVVRGSGLVRSATVEKVRRAIHSLGYRPDPALSALAAYRTKLGRPADSVLAFLDCDGTDYSRTVMEGAQQECSLLGYGLEHFPLATTKPAQQERLARQLFHRGVRGLLFGPSNEPAHLTSWKWKYFAAVSLGALAHEPQLHAVAADYFQGAIQAFGYLRQKGCRRIGFFVEQHLESRTGERWLGGYCAAALKAGQTPYYRQQLTTRNALQQWLRENRLDGLLTINSDVPQWIGRSRCHLFFLNSFHEPSSVPYLSLSPKRIGAEGVRVVHHLLLRREFGLPAEPKVVVLQSTIIAP